MFKHKKTLKDYLAQTFSEIDAISAMPDIGERTAAFVNLKQAQKDNRKIVTDELDNDFLKTFVPGSSSCFLGALVGIGAGMSGLGGFLVIAGLVTMVTTALVTLAKIDDEGKKFEAIDKKLDHEITTAMTENAPTVFATLSLQTSIRNIFGQQASPTSDFDKIRAENKAAAPVAALSKKDIGQTL